MKIRLVLVLIIFLCGCATSQHTRGTAAKSTFRSRGLSRQEYAIENACQKSRNIFYWNEAQLRKEFGVPAEELLSPKDPSGQTKLYNYKAVGRLMQVYIKNNKVIDVNYSTTTYGIGAGGGRRQRERQYAASLKKRENASLDGDRTDEYSVRSEQVFKEDSFLEEEGIIIEEKDHAIVAYMNGPEDGEGNIYPFEEEPTQEGQPAEDKFLTPVF